MDIEGNNPKQLTTGPALFISNLDCSPDGKWIVYSKSGPEKGLWKLPLEGGDSLRLTNINTIGHAVSPDGKMIAYSYSDREANPQLGMAIVPFEGGQPTKRFDAFSPPVLWAADSRSLLYVKSEGGASNLWSQPIVGGPPKPITHFRSNLILIFDLSPDGKWLLLGSGTMTSDAVLIREAK
jgi:Tol biopolymer transport system component